MEIKVILVLVYLIVSRILGEVIYRYKKQNIENEYYVSGSFYGFALWLLFPLIFDEIMVFAVIILGLLFLFIGIPSYYVNFRLEEYILEIKSGYKQPISIEWKDIRNIRFCENRRNSYIIISTYKETLKFHLNFIEKLKSFKGEIVKYASNFNINFEEYRF